MTRNHTPEPWAVFNADSIKGPHGNTIAECCGYSVKAQGAAQIAQGGREANAARIVDCVNGCAGINPSAVAGAIKALETLVASLAWEEQRSGITYSGYDDARSALKALKGES